MTMIAVEAFLARLYADEALRAAFLADPVGVARRAGVDEENAHRLEHIDREGLELAAESYSRKRAARAPKRAWWRIYP